MGAGKSSKQEQKVEIPKALEDAAKNNLTLAGDVGALGYMPNFAPQVAALTPSQTAAMQGTNSAAGAFGLSQNNAPNFGMPNAVNVGGFSGYSTEDLYKAAKAKLTPAQRKMLASFNFNPKTGAPPTNPSVKTSGNLVTGQPNTPVTPTPQTPSTPMPQPMHPVKSPNGFNQNDPTATENPWFYLFGA